MGAFSIIDNKKLKFWRAQTLNFEEFASTSGVNANELEDYQNGTIVEADSKIGLYIKANDGVLKILEIQGENAKKMSTADFLRGNHIEIGKVFQ